MLLQGYGDRSANRRRENKGLNRIVYCDAICIVSNKISMPKKEDLVEDNTALDKYRRVAHVEEFYDIIRDVHEKELLHGGYKKTFDKVQSLVTEYEWEWLSSVAEFVSRDSKKRGRKFVSLCPSCQLRKPQLSTPLKPIIANGFFLQIASILNTHVFPYFGVPRILHSDNGQEFVNMVIVDLLKCWNSNIQLVSGRPRHPQSRGLVERAHQTLHKKMAAEISASGMKTPPWSDWLPRIVYAMNIQVHDTTGASPYELVFSQKARTVIFPTQQNAIVLEEDLADEGIDVGISSEQATVISTSQYQAFRSEEDANTDVEQDAQCSMSSSHQGSTTQNVVNEAEDTLHAEVSAAECETIEREVLEKNDDKLNGNELKCNGKRKCL
eukprot:Em0005g1621a